MDTPFNSNKSQNTNTTQVHFSKSQKKVHIPSFRMANILRP